MADAAMDWWTRRSRRTSTSGKRGDEGEADAAWYLLPSAFASVVVPLSAIVSFTDFAEIRRHDEGLMGFVQLAKGVQRRHCGVFLALFSPPTAAPKRQYETGGSIGSMKPAAVSAV
jgi:hypothetical protein